jgi:hypothetical protein
MIARIDVWYHVMILWGSIGIITVIYVLLVRPPLKSARLLFLISVFFLIVGIALLATFVGAFNGWEPLISVLWLLIGAGGYIIGYMFIVSYLLRRQRRQSRGATDRKNKGETL